MTYTVERLPGSDDPAFTVRDASGNAVGSAALRGMKPENRRADIEVTVDNGAALTEVVRAVCRYAFDRLGLHRLQLWAAVGDATVAAFEAAGFVGEGVARDRLYQQGGWHDCVLLGLLAGEAT